MDEEDRAVDFNLRDQGKIFRGDKLDYIRWGIPAVTDDRRKGYILSYRLIDKLFGKVEFAFEALRLFKSIGR